MIITSISPTLGILWRNPSWHVRFTHQNYALLFFWHWSTLRILCFHVLILHGLLFCNSRKKFWQFQKCVQCLMNKTSKNFFFSYAFCLLTYCVSSTTSMLMHYWLQSLQLFWPVDVHSSHPLVVASLMTVYFGPRWLMFLLVLLLHFLFFTNICTCSTFFFAITFQDTNNILENVFLCTAPVIRHSDRITSWRRSACIFFHIYSVFVQLADCTCIYYLWSSLGLSF